jgi:hypothetical protein
MKNAPTPAATFIDAADNPTAAIHAIQIRPRHSTHSLPFRDGGRCNAIFGRSLEAPDLGERKRTSEHARYPRRLPSTLERDRWFESFSLQGRVHKPSVPPAISRG